MNYLAALLGIALLGAITTAAIYRADASDYKSQLVSLKASYAEIAQKAKDDAQKQIAADTLKNQQLASQAITEASSAASKANAVKALYLKKLAGLKPTDCANTPIPPGLLP